MALNFSRRLVLRYGLGGVALGAVTVAAGCSNDTSTGETGTEADGAATSAPDEMAATSGSPSDTWARANLGFVSAYVVFRGGQATVIDTGVEGSEGDIQAVLAAQGLDWGQVGDVILTHSHPDHIGSAAAIAAAAPDAAFHAGEADLPAIDIGRTVAGLVDGDTVFDLSILHTPGHTPGHISVLDKANSILMSGDALTGDAGKVGLPNPEFTPDYEEALRSVRYLGTLDFATAYFGHGEPVTSGASDQTRALGEQEG